MTNEQVDLIVEHEKLIYSIISKYKGYFDKDDLYQVGVIGLLNAKENYNSGYNTKFSTYAYTYILGEISKYVREDRSIKVSKDILKRSKLVERTKELMTQKLMREPTILELSLYLDLDEIKIEEAISAKEYIKSLDKETNEEGKGVNLYDYVQDKEQAYKPEVMDLNTILSSLTEEEKNLINMRYYQGYTQQETSQELGTSQVQISRKESKILNKIKDKMIA